ncbi:MAG TPA: pilus assembly protein TadG-related protein [Vineibacter sp.]|nr:pilus assembly protein TadG-related protein [Vineibacter sp.]
MKRLLRASDGGTLTLVGLAVPLIVGGLAMAIDTGIWYLEKRKTQQIADGASLGAMRTLKSGGTLTTARQVALADAQRNGYAVVAGSTFQVNSPPVSGPYAGQTNAVEVMVTRGLPTFFSRYFLTNSQSVSARSVSYTGTTLGKNLELSMMLDVSGSMSGGTEVYGLTKLAAMKDAAKQLVDIVVQPVQTPYTSRVALVPYSSAVNVGSTYYSAVTGQSPQGNWYSVVERKGSTAMTDDPPGANNWIREFRLRKSNAMGAYASWVQNVSYNVPASTSALKPLSTNKTALKSTIDSFTASGTTAGHIGTAWAWYTVSPRWSGIFTGAAAPNAYNPATTHKAVVLLSDFDMNSYYQSTNGNSTTQTRELCTNMKQAGVVVYTIGYGVDQNNSTAVNLWNDCATDSTKVFSVTNTAELTAAFRAIALSAVGGAMNDDIRLGE